MLASCAAYSADSDIRVHKEPSCQVRTSFQRDCHRIVHSKSFRRLRGKTQVFLWPHGDHYRTRLTHCQEVSQIVRTLARALDLNEDLAEAIALGHDLGHTPFGHAGEATLQKLMPGGFRHEQQSLRVVESLENNGRGLNLTEAVRDGIVKHSKGAGPLLNVSPKQLPKTMEGQLVRVADVIAYMNHDLDDALRARVIAPGDVPAGIVKIIGDTHSARVTYFVLDVINSSNVKDNPKIAVSEEASDALEKLRVFLYENVYYNKKVHAEFHKATDAIERLWNYFINDLQKLYEVYWPGALKDGSPEDDVRDFIAGMTDAYAVTLHEEIFTPKRWYVL